MQALAADLVVEDELRQAEREHEVEHARAGHRIDAGERREQRAAECLAATLGVEKLAIRESHVGLGRQIQRLGDRDIGDVEVLRLDGRHRRTRGLHVEGRRCAAEQYGRSRADDLGHRDAGQDVDAVKDQRAHERYGRNQAHQRDRHDLDRDAGLDAVEQVLAGVLAVAEVAGRRDREDRHRFRDQVVAIRAEQLLHLDHARHAVFGERAGDDGFL